MNPYKFLLCIILSGTYLNCDSFIVKTNNILPFRDFKHKYNPLDRNIKISMKLFQTDNNIILKSIIGSMLLGIYVNTIPPVIADDYQVSNTNPQWRYSEFINQVQDKNVEKVTFTSDGKQLTAIDTEGYRHQLPSIPNDPNLIDTLVSNNVDVTVLSQQDQTINSNVPEVLITILYPIIVFSIILFVRY